jgi:riboflavin kinase/FMN adenylyltransferase
MVGHNFRFGHGHEGNLDTLRKQWSHAFEVIAVPPVEDRGIAISSSMIRGRIGAGDVSTVRRMLGRCYQIEGRLVPGAGRGRRVTVPTLNLESRNALVPADGVYLTRIGVDGGPLRDAVTNVGVRPTFSSGPGESRTIETHVLDADLPAGSSEARLRFVKRLRDEVRFPDASTLRQRIIHDVGLARRYFRRLALLREEAAVGSRDAGR